MPDTETAGQPTNAAEVAQDHPGWSVWKDRPYASRTSVNLCPRTPPPVGYAQTVLADSWPELHEKLEEQDDIDLLWRSE